MSQQYQTTKGNLVTPGAYSDVTVANNPSGLSTNGVVTLVGEADGGPDYSLEADLTAGWGSDQISDVKNRYMSGPLVDAFAAAATPSNDPDIQTAPSKIILIKTNVSGRASLALTQSSVGAGSYGKLYDLGYGNFGNSTYSANTATSEVPPTTGAFTWLLNIASLNADLRLSGGTAAAFTVGALTTPAALVTQVNGLAAGVTASGGASRGLLGGVAGNLALAIVAGNQVTITYTLTWGTTPLVGDTVYIPSGSVIQGAGNQNRGCYVVTAATSSVISATKLQDASGSPGALTSPAAVSSVAVNATTDVQGWAPVTIAVTSSTPIDGVGKTLEVNALTTGTDVLTNNAYALGTTKVTWISTAGTPVVLASGTEYSVSLADSRNFDNKSETIPAGGQIALKVGYKGTTATLTVATTYNNQNQPTTTLATTVTGGSGANLSMSSQQFQTLNDVQAYVNAQAGYTCSVGTLTLGQLPMSALDTASAMGVCTDFGAQPGRIKVDAYKFAQAVAQNSSLVTYSSNGSPTAASPARKAGAGLPASYTTAFLSGGSRGGTTDAAYNTAIDALQRLRLNFVVPLFSADASSSSNPSDISDGLTDSSSTYTRANVHAYTKTHVLNMSTLKRRRNRQAFLSTHDSFLNAQNQAATLASNRASLNFQDVKNVSATGAGVQQYRPWMGAVLAAGMQAAGGYQGIVGKYVNCQGAVMYDGSFSDADDTMVENALLAGLLPIKNVPKEDGGGFTWISDQTTYGADANWIFNSIQATYVTDLVALSSAIRMERAFKGKSVADISAALALSAFEGIMKDMIRLKYIAPSDDAPLGFKNLSVRIVGPALVVKVEIKVAGLIYFIPINFLVTQVQQTAGTV